MSEEAAPLPFADALKSVKPRSMQEVPLPPYQFNLAQQEWLKDLRTTKAPQVKGYLFATGRSNAIGFGFCCLGRACLIFDVPMIPRSYAMAFQEDASGSETVSHLPIQVVAQLRLRDGVGVFHKSVEIGGRCYDSLTNMNDHLVRPLTFSEIAAYIEHDPWNVFADPAPKVAQNAYGGAIYGGGLLSNVS